MRLHRFYVLQPLGEEVVISDSSVLKQWKNVFKYTPGVFVALFNGDGCDYVYSIESISSKECTLTLTKHSPVYMPKKKVTLYLSVIKKDNFELVAQKATELGVTKIVPILSARSEKKNLNDERLQKIAVEASEQCGRGDVPEIAPIVKLEQAINSLNSNETTLVLQMGGLSFNEESLKEKLSTSNSINLFIGPEGGWDPLEEDLFTKHEVALVSLGNTVLRAETAAIVASAFCCQ